MIHRVPSDEYPYVQCEIQMWDRIKKGTQRGPMDPNRQYRKWTEEELEQHALALRAISQIPFEEHKIPMDPDLFMIFLGRNIDPYSVVDQSEGQVDKLE